MDMSKSKSASPKGTGITRVDHLVVLPKESPQTIYKLLFEPRKSEDAKK